MARKWILNENELRMGHVELHRELRSKGDNVPGGGYFYWIDEANVMLLYGSSSDFGTITKEQFQEMDVSGSIERRGLDIHFSDRESLENAVGQFLKGETTKYDGPKT